MAYRLATEGETQFFSTIRRFDPAFWQVNFANTMHGCMVTTGGDPSTGITVDMEFRWKRDLMGLIWYSKDLYPDHPLIRYAQARDYTGITLSFHLKLTGDVPPLNDVNGLTLTIEKWDTPSSEPPTGSTLTHPKYVRLINYAVDGTLVDDGFGNYFEADFTLDFDTILGGFNVYFLYPYHLLDDVQALTPLLLDKRKHVTKVNPSRQLCFRLFGR